MGHPSRNIKDIGAEDYMNCGSLALEISKEKNFCMWLRDCSYEVLMKSISTFCPCLKSLPEAK